MPHSRMRAIRQALFRCKSRGPRITFESTHFHFGTPSGYPHKAGISKRPLVGIDLTRPLQVITNIISEKNFSRRCSLACWSAPFHLPHSFPFRSTEGSFLIRMPVHSTHRPRASALLRRRLLAQALGWCLLLCGLTSSLAFAQQFQARLLGQSDGLGNLSITAIAQDAEGFLWVGTQNGVFRYDGSQFREYGRDDGFTEPIVFSLYLDHTGTLWAGTHSGLYWFNGVRFQQVQYQGKNLRIGQNSMLSSTSNGELVAQTPSDLFSVTKIPSHQGGGAHWRAVPYHQAHPVAAALDDTNGILVDRQNRLILGCRTAICIVSDSSVQTLGPTQHVPPDYYVSLFQARDGTLWARGRTHIVTWQPAATSVLDLSALFPPGAERTVYRRFTQDKAGNLLTPTAAGFATWDGATWTETPVTSAGLINGATDVFADPEGSVWIGTLGTGLLHALGYQQWASYGMAQGLAGAHVSSIVRTAAVGAPGHSAHTVWVGNSLGVNLLLPGATHLVPSPLARLAASHADTHNIISLAPDASGGTWMATLLGHLYHFNPVGAEDRHAAVDDYVDKILLAPDGVLWVATGTALYHLECGHGPACTALPVIGASGHRLPAADMLPDGSGGLWTVGQEGLAHVTGGAVATPVVPHDAAGLLRNLRRIAMAPDGSFWVAGELPGILHIRLINSQISVLGSLRRPALASDEVSFLSFDPSARLWIGTDHGVNVLEKGRLLLLTDEDGLIWNDSGEGAFLADPDGTVWIGTSQGLSHLLHPEAALHRSPFKIALETVSYGKTPFPPSGKMPWTGMPVTAYFSALTFRDNESIVYHYRLKGVRDSYTSSTGQSAVFSALAPGRYVFQLIAEDTHHGLFSAPVSFAFTLQPPWWRTWLFYFVATLLALVFVATLWRSSHLVLLAQRSKFKRLVAERTRELEDLAIHDSLTGLLNRKAILDALAVEIEQGVRRKTAFCVALVDLDHFKQINDSHGHLAGDEVLRQSALRLAAAVRSSDLVGRYGGEEFFVVLRGADTQFGLERCEHVRQMLCAAPIAFESLSITITCSVGLVCTNKEGDTVTDVIARADAAMYSAKSTGRNRVVAGLSVGDGAA